MQYVVSSVASQYLVFEKPTGAVLATDLEFRGYGVSFDVGVTSVVNEGDYVKVYFTLSAGQAAVFTTKVSIKVRWGDAFDYVYGMIPGSNVIQYSNED